MTVRSGRGMARARPGVEVAAREALRHEEAPEGDLTVVLASARRLQALNRRFAGEDHTTDVLSFVDGSRDAETGRLYFGDVVIAVPVAEAQAAAAGHSLQAEMSLLAVHGVLHLLGHDHARPEERRRMETAQSAILAALADPERHEGNP